MTTLELPSIQTPTDTFVAAASWLVSDVVERQTLVKSNLSNGWALVCEGNYGDAITFFNNALAQGTSFEEALHGLGHAYLAGGNIHAARKALQQVKRRNSDVAYAYGYSLFLLGEYKQAAEAFFEIPSEDSAYRDAKLYAIGATLLARDKASEARECFRGIFLDDRRWGVPARYALAIACFRDAYGSVEFIWPNGLPYVLPEWDVLFKDLDGRWISIYLAGCNGCPNSRSHIYGRLRIFDAVKHICF